MAAKKKVKKPKKTQLERMVLAARDKDYDTAAAIADEPDDGTLPPLARMAAHGWRDGENMACDGYERLINAVGE